ncbi:hypothetical protein [Subtercola sp. YIM 133946]|uniref:hypothetical protein n=1 Tax=Subtercola sp. YIM 133946 TaxID=3118909 RepID=UPI002F94D580
MTTLTTDHPAPAAPAHSSAPAPTPEERSHLLHPPLRTDADIEERVMSAIGTACRTQLWLLLLDAHDRQLPIALPCDDLAPKPRRGDADTLVAFMAGLMADRGATQLIAVWERPGGGALGGADAAWATALAEACDRRGVRLRAQLHSHSRGVTLLP